MGNAHPVGWRSLNAPNPDDVWTCEKCGEKHLTRNGFRACNGHIRGIDSERKGRPCQRFPNHGTTVCIKHGANTAQTKKKAAERMAEKAAAELAQTFGVPVEATDPGSVILERISAVAGHVRWLQTRVQELTPDDVIWGKTREKTGGHDAGTTWEAAANGWVILYERWDKQLQRLCLEALKVGLQERQVRLAEQEGAVICRLLDGLLLDFGIDPQQPETAEKVAKHLRLVS